jgi:hypothetical protein
MPYKPMPPKDFKKYIEMVNWKLEKGGIDWNLYSEDGEFLYTIQISHGSRTKSEVTAGSVRKVEKEFKERGWKWPPQKKLKKN